MSTEGTGSWSEVQLREPIRIMCTELDSGSEVLLREQDCVY